MRRSSFCLFSALGLFATANAALANITVRFDLSNSVVGLGDIFTVDIVADIPSPDAFVGFGMDVAFNTAILGHTLFGDVTIAAPFLQTPTGDGDGLGGLLLPPPFPLPPPPPVFGTDVLLATMSFEALAVGTTTLVGSHTSPFVDPTEGFSLPGFPPTFATVDFVEGSVTVIPAPGAAVLGLLGFGLVGWVKRWMV